MGLELFSVKQEIVLGIIYMQSLLQRGKVERHVTWHQLSFRILLRIHKLGKFTASARNVHCVIKGWNETVMQY